MTASLRAEWLKLVTTRAFYGLTVGAALVSAFFAFGTIAQSPPPWDLSGPLHTQIGGVAAMIAGLFSLILGARAFTEEFRYGTIVHTVFADPHRTRSSIAKAVASAAGAVVLTAVSVTAMAGVAYAMAAFGGGGLSLHAADLAAALGLCAAGALWAVLGVGLGAVVRQPVPAVVVALLWVLLIENLAAGLLGGAGRYLPGQTAQVLARGAGETSDVVLAAGVMVAWAVALWALGWTMLRRRDVI